MFKDLRQLIYVASIVVVIISVGGMIGMQYLMEKWTNGFFLGQGNIRFLFKIFLALFLVFYCLLVTTALLKYVAKRRLCTKTNWKIVILSVLAIYPLSWKAKDTRETRSYIKSLLEPSEKSCSNKNSPLYFMNLITDQGYHVLCSMDCPCNGNPMIFQDDPEVVIYDVTNKD